MFQYQARFGSLFLDIGLISSLFMFGSFAGSMLTERLLRRGSGRRRGLLPGCLSLNLVVLGLVAAVSEGAPRAAYAALFVGVGLCVGLYFPIGAARLRAAGQSPAAAGASLEMLDHWGGAAGALASGWLLLPLLGTWLTLGVLALLIGVNLVPPAVRARPPRRPAGADGFDRLVRPAGYWLLGAAASVLAASQIAAAAAAGTEEERVLEAARAMTASENLAEATAVGEDGSPLRYWIVPESDGDKGGVFSSESLGGVPATAASAMAVYVARDGNLRAADRPLGTPAYVESRRLAQRAARPTCFEQMDWKASAVSGA